MSFQIWKRQSAAAPSSNVEAAGPAVLPAALISAGAKRIAPFALLAACLQAAFTLVERATIDQIGVVPASRTLWLGATVALLGLSLSVAWIADRQMMAPEKLLDLGLLYEVAAAFCLALVYHAVPFPGTFPRGWTGVSVWVLVFPLIIPNTRAKIAVATVLDRGHGSARPLAPPGGRRAATPDAGRLPPFIPTVMAVVVAIFVHRIVYQISVEAGKGLDMGSYHLEELLGRGGMGEVWRASHRMLARSAADQAHPARTRSAPAGQDVLKRFEREAQATATLRSPHTVEVYDFGTTEGGTFYYVMELLEGYDSETLVQAYGPLSPARAVYLLRQICQSLMEAHERGLVHRDIKPANIYVCRYGLEHDFIKVLDFGLVKSNLPIGGHNSAVTAAGIVAGTAEYISPEMARGDAVDARADLYALGCVAYWLLTGKLVFEGGSPMEILIEHVKTRPTPPSQKTTQAIPPALEEIILSLLQKDPNNRPQTARELEAKFAALALPSPWTEAQAERWWREHPPEQAPRRWVKPGTNVSAVGSKASPIRAAG